MSEYKPKQVILVRTDLNMPAGKIASQVAHASMKVFFDQAVIDRPFGDDKPIMVTPMTEDMVTWKEGEFLKIVLAVNSEEQLLSLYAKAVHAGLPASLIQDNGHTVFKGVKTFTTVAIGPADPALIDELTGANSGNKLRLLP